MKERNLVSGGRVGCRYAIGFEPIARRTSQTSVLEDRRASRRTRQNVLDFKDRNASVFGRPAIGAAVGETIANLALEIDRNVGAHRRLAATRWCNVYLARVLTVVR